MQKGHKTTDQKQQVKTNDTVLSCLPRSLMISLTMYLSMPLLCSGWRKERNSSSFSSWSAGGLSAWNQRSFRLSNISWAVEIQQTNPPSSYYTSAPSGIARIIYMRIHFSIRLQFWKVITHLSNELRNSSIRKSEDNFTICKYKWSFHLLSSSTLRSSLFLIFSATSFSLKPLLAKNFTRYSSQVTCPERGTIRLDTVKNPRFPSASGCLIMTNQLGARKSYQRTRKFYH